MTEICVAGAGAWGTALALGIGRSTGLPVSLWGRDEAVMREMQERRENRRHLPGVPLPPALRITHRLAEALAGAEVVLLAVPAQQLRGVLPLLAGHLNDQSVPLVLCAKGIEVASGKMLSDVVKEVFPGNPVCALSGPSFAADLGRGLPTAVVVAAENGALAAELAQRFSGETFRCYSTDDLPGVEIGGALKNVFASAAGAAAGAGLGASAEAALVTRGFVELRRLAALFGGRPETPMGLSGLGDLLLTCASPQSRNYSYGVALGKGEPLEGRPLAEGVPTAAIAAKLASARGIDAPIVAATAAILAGRLTIGEAVAALMTRPLKSENG